jgi:hypothetical protein
LARAYSMNALPKEPVPPVMRIDEPSRMDTAKPPRFWALSQDEPESDY